MRGPGNQTTCWLSHLNILGSLPNRDPPTTTPSSHTHHTIRPSQHPQITPVTPLLYMTSNDGTILYMLKILVNVHLLFFPWHCLWIKYVYTVPPLKELGESYMRLFSFICQSVYIYICWRKVWSLVHWIIIKNVLRVKQGLVMREGETGLRVDGKGIVSSVRV